MKLVTVAEMKAIENEANEGGVTYAMMMEKAGKGVAEATNSAYSQLEVKVVTGLVGSGNNGGDTLVALRHLAGLGWKAMAYLVRSREDGDPLLQSFVEAGGEVLQGERERGWKALNDCLNRSSVLLDGVLGTGIKLPLKPEIAKLLGHVAAFNPLPQVVAVDCPSGVDCDSGEAAPECIPANLTVSMEAVKTGLLIFPAFKFIGDLQVVDLGLPVNLESAKNINREVVDQAWVRKQLPARPLDSHKGTFGTAVIAAGSINYTGAALLSATAAYRIGAGLVRLAVPGPLHAALAGQLPEVTWLILPHEQGVISENAAEILSKNLEKVNVLLLGPGWGMEDTTASFLQRLLTQKAGHSRGAIGFVGPLRSEAVPVANDALPPLVIDADGLKLLARIPDWPKYIKTPAVLTPHPGEMAVLTGLKIEEIQANRLEIANKYAHEWGQVVILKGAGSVVAAPDGRIAVIPIATSALAHAGTGDVLAGMVTGLRSQGVAPFEAAASAAWMHARAGVLAAEWLGHPASVLATDVIDSIAEVLQEVSQDLS
jgi:ADP-dependent NAD(P)H-hydrate dehydratase / NAD(P)H-hydrate epimerase